MKIKQIFWNGLKTFIPMALTVGIVAWGLVTIDAFFGAVLKGFFPDKVFFKGAGILLGVVFIFILGVLVNAWLVKSLYDMLDRLVKRIPFIKSIYNAIQELVDFFDKDNSTGHQTVLIDTPVGKVIGFITRDSIRDLPFGNAHSEEVLVYVPLSYQIGGFMLSLPKDKITIIDWPMDTAMSFVLTAGMTKGVDKKIS